MMLISDYNLDFQILLAGGEFLQATDKVSELITNGIITVLAGIVIFITISFVLDTLDFINQDDDRERERARKAAEKIEKENRYRRYLSSFISPDFID